VLDDGRPRTHGRFNQVIRTPGGLIEGALGIDPLVPE
jgi:hypothetical protein